MQSVSWTCRTGAVPTAARSSSVFPSLQYIRHFPFGITGDQMSKLQNATLATSDSRKVEKMYFFFFSRNKYFFFFLHNYEICLSLYAILCCQLSTLGWNLHGTKTCFHGEQASVLTEKNMWQPAWLKTFISSEPLLVGSQDCVWPRWDQHCAALEFPLGNRTRT